MTHDGAVHGCDDVGGNDLDGTVQVQVGNVLNGSPGKVAIGLILTATNTEIASHAFP